MNPSVFVRIVGLLLLCLGIFSTAQAQAAKPAGPLPAQPPNDQKQDAAAADTDAKADAEKKKKAEEAKKLNDKLKEFEDELIERERLGDYGLDEVLQYSNELSKEYRRNRDSLEHGELQDDVRLGLQRRQKLIRLYLWELKRVGPTLAAPETSQNSISSQLSKLLRDYRTLLSQDQQLMGRVQGLLRRAYNVRNNQMRRRSGNSTFHFEEPNEAQEDDAQANVPANPAVQAPNAAGAKKIIDDSADPVRRLLKVAYQDGRLVLDRNHWEKPFLGKSITDIAKDVESQLTQRGVKIPSNVKNQPVPQIADRPHAVLLFENLQHAATKMGGRSSYSTGNGASRWSKRFSSGGVEWQFIYDDDRFMLNMNSEFNAMQQVRVSCADPNSLKITSLTDDRVFLFEQKAEGPVRLVDITDAEPVSQVADSFAQLYAEQPEIVEDLLFPALGELNFVLPPTRFDPDMIERVISNIRGVSPEASAQFAELLEQIGGKSFSTRDRATRELNKNLDQYLPFVLDAYRQDQLPLEVKTRLKLVLERYEEEWRELDGLIAKMALTEDADYLVPLLSLVEQRHRPLVADQLEKVTTQQFGADIDAWKKWLADQKPLADG
jgi:hypothetical protein